MSNEMNHKQLPQHQLEEWLSNPVTKYYLQALWNSQDQIKEAIGNGGCIDFSSMERTFAETLMMEGKKQGYLSAMEVVSELARHELIEEDAKLVDPDCKDIINTIIGG
jgi:hypothetical protein